MNGAPHPCRGGFTGCGTPRLSSGLGLRCGHEASSTAARGTRSALGTRGALDMRAALARTVAGSAGHGLPSTADPSTLLVYVMDIYDPASWDYLPSVSAVLSAACSLVDVEVVQSGRYAASAPAACLIALLAAAEIPVSTILGAVQHEYFVGGRPLDAPGVLGSISAGLGLDGPAIELFAASERARELAAEDFELAQDFDLGGGPLLIASRGEQIFEFDGPGATGARLVDQFRTVLTRQ
jgi:protein-disulfide isomerase-like protein with CxxC motif